MKIIKTSKYKESQQKPIIPQKIKSKINVDLQKRGLDETTNWDEIGPALSEIHAVLKSYGINVSDILSGDLFMEDQGRRTFNLEWTNRGDEQFMPGTEIENSMLVVSWYPKQYGGVGVSAYVS